MFARCCVLLALSMLPGWTQEAALVRVGESWRYFKGTQEPASPAAAWRELAFDDRTWAAGISGLSHGYGEDYDEPTRLPDFGTTYLSVYARKSFSLTNLTQVRWLTLRIDYNDGFVAYLNGTEVARRNLAGAPGSFVPFNVPATATHLRGLPEEIDLTPWLPVLRQGTNVLAIQVHASAFLDFNFTLLPELLCNFTRGPFIQNASTNRVQVIWKTPYPSDSVVEYGVTLELGQSVTVVESATTHVVTLEGLAPETTYHYRVRSQAGQTVVLSALATFQTLKDSGPVNFVVLGDSGSGSLAQYQIADQMQKANRDLVMHVGDVIYPLFTTNQVDARCFSVYQPHMRSTPFFFAIGNHDLYAGDFAYLDAFFLPTNAVTGTEHFYSFDHGDAHFTVLLQPYASQYLLTPGDNQYNWLTNDLATTAKPWKFIFLHVPIASSGAHRFDDYAQFGTADNIDIRNALLPVAAQYGVQMIFAGHDHNYERFNPMNGVHSIVAGGGGVALRWLAQLDSASSQFWVVHHFLRVTVNGDKLSLRAVNTEGQVFDSITVQRALPSPRIYESAWNTPEIEVAPADDGDGNINGQGFQFAGDPIPTLPGLLSNLGQVFVNNDQTNLYVGFEQCMINPDANIFLFIESPKLTGVTNLAGTGNGMIDPDAGGADGLDFLENLSFTNFAPGIGVILGDEFGDAQARSFTRLGLALNIGQGAFYLEAQLRDVAGLRLQQFNRSPQTGGIPGEENANFIKLAIPFGALGDVRPGDVLKLGAVVGLGSFDTNATRQTRELDASFLGSARSGSGQGSVRLEGLPVKLAIHQDGDEDGDGLTNRQETRIGTDMFNPDTDGDGLTDGWEAAHDLNPLSRTEADGSDGDPDGDGLSNAREQLLGTNPRDVTSAVRLTIEPLGQDRFRFSWPTVVGKRYALEYTERLQSGFTNFSGRVFPMNAASTNQSYVAGLPLAARTNATQFFFRVRLVE